MSPHPMQDDDLTQLGPAAQPEARKRQRIDAMLRALPSVLEALRQQVTDTVAAAQQAAAGGAAVAPAPAEPQQGAAGGVAALKGAVDAAVATTLPEAQPGDTQHADGAFSDDEGGEGGAEPEAELAAAADAAVLPSDLDSLRALLAELPW